MSAVKPTYRNFPLPPAPFLTASLEPKSTDEIADAVRALAPDAVLAVEAALKGDSSLVIDPARLPSIVRFLRDDPRFACTMLSVISAVDYPARPGKTADEAGAPARIEVIYVLFSHRHRFQVLLKAKLDRAEPRIASITDLYRAANWYERECYDMLGVWFEGHPHLERILLPPDWVGHPLRKDYVFPEEYNGMKVPL